MFDNVFKDKKVLITGNTGFKGSWLTAWLLRLGANVYGISKDIPTTPSMFKVLELEERIVHYDADIRNIERIQEIVYEVQPDFLFHMAAQPIVALSYIDPIETLSSNIMGTANILETLRVLNHPCVAVIITSDKCYDNVEWIWGYKETDTLGGKDIYSSSKAAAEIVFKSYFHSFFKDSDVKLSTCRAGNVIGGGDWAPGRIVPDCIRSWSEKKSVEIRNPLATRPWQHVLEPLSGYLTLASTLKVNESVNGESFNFGPKAEQNYTVQKLIKDISVYWDFKDDEVAYSVTQNDSFHEAGLLKLNCDKALYYFNWMPTLEYEQMIEFVAHWYHAFYNTEENMFDYTLKQIEAYEMAAKHKDLQWSK
ncbi:CDP-glucose 4,6-dehydratase [bacterium]|nr:CDP-glucose 4,6-dehydratase [bacterium]